MFQRIYCLFQRIDRDLFVNIDKPERPMRHDRLFPRE